jgi:pilus assembly protein FimV
VEAQLQQCEAMTSKLAAIEGKVQRLQTALVAPAAVARMPASAVPPSTAPKADAADPGKPAVAPPKPDPAPVKPGATPVKPAVAADLAANSRTRLAMIIGGVLAGLAALGGAIFFLRKRQDRGPLKIWQSFRKKGSAVIEEPVPELTEQVAAQ